MKRLLQALILSIFLISTPWAMGADNINSSRGRMDPPFTDFRDIPGVTQEDIRDVEALRNTRTSFKNVGPMETELFVGQDGKIYGFQALFAKWLTELFGIPFEMEILDWNQVISELDSHEADFNGDLTMTPERLEHYFMTDTIAERTIRMFRLMDAEDLSILALSRPIRVIFLSDTITPEVVLPNFRFSYEQGTVDGYDEAHAKLLSGEADAFFDEGIAEAAFDKYLDIKAEELLPMVYTGVSLTTHNPDNEVIIRVVQKALNAGATSYLVYLYNQGERDYRRNKFKLNLSPEELRFLNNRIATDDPVMYAAESDNYPISFWNPVDMEFQGVSQDVIKQIEELSGLSFEPANPKSVEWPELLQMLQSGKASMISELIGTKERELYYIWADTPFSTDSYALLSKSETPNKELNEILYSTVGLIDDTAYSEVFRSWFPDHKHNVSYATTDLAFQALERGEIELMMGTSNLNLSMTNYLEQPGYKVNYFFDSTFGSYFGFNKNETILRSIVSKALPLIDTKNIGRRWMQRTFDYRGKLARERMPWLIGTVALLILLLALSAMLIVRHSRHRVILEAQVKERTSELEEQKEAANAASKAKGDFLARMSHEIRTPMNAIIGMAELAMRENMGSDAKDMIGNIKHAGNSLIAIINDILDFSKIESGRMEIVESTYHLSSLIHDVISIASTRLAEKPIDFLVEVDSNLPALLHGDEVRLRQILFNLLSNAAKYTESGYVIFRAEGALDARKVSINLDFSIMDSGKGIKPEDMERLFGVFNQFSQAENKGIEGTGLGLAISKNLAMLMGGDIEASSVYGEGSNFSLKLKQTVFGKYVPLASIRDPNLSRLLVVEPRPLQAKSLRWTLDRLEASYILVEDMELITQQLKANRFFYVISSAIYSEKVLDSIRLSGKPDIKTIFIAKQGERGTKERNGAMVTPGPIFCVPLANILNDVEESGPFQDASDKVSFTAPDARVLVVDDLPINLKVAKGLMTPFKVQVDTCESGMDAISKVENINYDIVFMDHMMPVMDGIEATERIRALPRGKTVPIIALTANAISGVKEMFIEHGMNDFISKPIELNKLESALHKWIPESKRLEVVNAPEESPAPEATTEPSVINMVAPKADLSEEDSLESFDPGYSLAKLANDKELQREVLGLYLKSSQEILGKMEDIASLKAGKISDPSFLDYAKLAHSLNASSLNIGAHDASKLASLLEDAAKNHDATQLEKYHQNFTAVMHHLLSQIEDYLGKDSLDKSDPSIGATPKAEAPSPTASEANKGEEAQPSATANTKVSGGFDPNKSLTQLGGDPELLREVLELYVDSTPAMLEKLRGLSEETLPDYAVAAHSLKGASLNVGADKVGQLAAEMEQAAKAKDMPKVLEGNQNLIDTTEALISEMNSFLKDQAE